MKHVTTKNERDRTMIEALNHSAQGLTVRFGGLGNEASLLGAGRLALENYFEIPALKLPRFMIETVKVPARRNPSAETAP